MSSKAQGMTWTDARNAARLYGIAVSDRNIVVVSQIDELLVAFLSRYPPAVREVLLSL